MTPFGKVLIIKSLGLSQIVYAAFNVPNEIKHAVKNALFGFLWNNRKDKIKPRPSESIYQDCDKGGIVMTDDKIIPRLLNPDIHNWKSIQDILLKKISAQMYLRYKILTSFL